MCQCRGGQPGVGRACEETPWLGHKVGMVRAHLMEISSASKELGLCPWAAGSPGKLLSRRGSTRAALWKTPSGRCTEGLEEK